MTALNEQEEFEFRQRAEKEAAAASHTGTSKFTFTSPEGKSYDVEGPEGATKEQAFAILQQNLGEGASAVPPGSPSLTQLERALVNADKAGDTAAATTLAGEIKRRRSASPDVGAAFAKGEASSLIPGTPPQPKPPKDEPSTANALIAGAPEAVAAMGTGAVGSGVANIVAAVREIAARTLGADQQTGRLEGQEAGGKVADAMTYQPRGPSGKKAVQTIGELIEASKIGGLNPAMPIGSLMRPGASEMLKAAGRRGEHAVHDVGFALGDVIEGDKGTRGAPSAPAMAGVGSAETDVARMRRERAASLPVPIKLSKGQATRDFEQQRFERETAKDGEVGKTIREHFAEQNEQVLQNFDTWVEQTGAEAPTLRATGQVVDEALVGKAKRAKASINAAYDKARASGEMEAPVSTGDLVAYLEKNRPAAINAPVLTTIEQKLVQLGGATKTADGALVPGRISVNDMEELRKLVGEVSGSTPTNVRFGAKTKELIDAATDGAGGKLYRQARALRTQYAKEFEHHAVVAKLLDSKGADRAVALEDVFAHSILNRSRDDVRHLQQVLQDEGPKGQQAWKDLQGQTVNHIKEQATRGVTTDVRGNPIVSPAALNKVVKELDSSGKLELVLGKQGAEQMRDLADLAKDVYTSPPGTVNTSNTGAVILNALGKMALGRLGTAGEIISAARKTWADRKVTKRIRDALDDPTTRDRPVRELLE